MKGNSRRLRTYAECVSTKPELDVDMDAVAARETVTEIVTETARERDNAFVAFGLFGVCWWQRQTAKATANALRCCKLVLSCKRPQGARDTLASQQESKATSAKEKECKGRQGEKFSPPRAHFKALMQLTQ